MKPCRRRCLPIIFVLLLSFCLGACGKKYNIEIKPYIVFERYDDKGLYLRYVEVNEKLDITADFYYHSVNINFGLVTTLEDTVLNEPIDCSHLRTNRVGNRDEWCDLIRFKEENIEEYKKSTITADFYDYFDNEKYITSYEVKVFDDFDFSRLSE